MLDNCITRVGGACLVGLMVLAAGCTTMSGGGQIDRAVFSTHRTVQKLDRDLTGSVAKLNQTAAELDARVEASDTQMRRIQGMVEETQFKLDVLEARLEDLTTTICTALNLTPPAPRTWSKTPPHGVSVREEDIEVVLPSEAESAITVSPALSDELPEPVGGDPVSDYRHAQTVYVNGRYQEALELFDAFIKRYPGTELCSRAQYRKAYCYKKLGKLPEAIAEYENLRKDYPNSPRVPASLRHQAAAHLELGQKARAEALLEELTRKYPTDAAAEGAKEALDELRGN